MADPTQNSPAPQRVFTLMLCGTCATEEDTYEHVASLGELFTKDKDQLQMDSWLIHDGPGSGNRDEDFSKFIFPNVVTPYPYTLARGIATGAGTDETLKNCVAALKAAHEDEEKGPITQINIVGWSRGAYNGIRVANALYKDDALKNIPVNIMAFDPVPGAGNHGRRCKLLKPNVREYHSLISLNEHSAGFTPIAPIKSDPTQETLVNIKTIPGNHGTGVGVFVRTQESGVQVDDIIDLPVITKKWMHETLRRWNIPVTLPHTVLEINEKELWRKVHAKRSEYEKLGTTSYTTAFDYVLKEKQGDRTVSHRKISTMAEDRVAHLSEYLPNMKMSQPDIDIKHYEKIGIGLVPETCTLHQEFNDKALVAHAAKLLDEWEVNSAYIKSLYQLIELLEMRQSHSFNEQMTRHIEALRNQFKTCLGDYINNNPMNNSMAWGRDSMAITPDLIPADFNLCNAVEADNYEIVLHFIEKDKTLVNSANDEGVTPLMVASRNGNKAIAYLLINNDAALFAKDSSGQTALSYAAGRGHTKLVKALLEADGEADHSTLVRAVIEASAHGHAETAKRLLEELYHIDEDDGLDDFSAGALCSWAVAEDKTKLAKAFVEHYPALVRPTLMRINSDRKNAADIATGNQNIDLVRLLGSIGVSNIAAEKNETRGKSRLMLREMPQRAQRFETARNKKAMDAVIAGIPQQVNKLEKEARRKKYEAFKFDAVISQIKARGISEEVAPDSNGQSDDPTLLQAYLSGLPGMADGYYNPPGNLNFAAQAPTSAFNPEYMATCVFMLGFIGLTVASVATGGLTSHFTLHALKSYTGYALGSLVATPALTYYGAKKGSAAYQSAQQRFSASSIPKL